MLTAQKIIEMFKMKPHPAEGGYYAETYRSSERIAKSSLPERYNGDRAFCTAILFLLTSKTVSKLHRLRSDEIFHFYLGRPVSMLLLFPDNPSRVVTLGPDLIKGQLQQFVVTKDTWMGCFVQPPGRFALIGTTVSPGFEFDDFEAADRQQLLSQYPSQEDLILKLT